MKVVLVAWRDAAWAAFWRRQAKHLPPNAVVILNNCTAPNIPAGAIGFKIETGREWR
jgi:hypothetical protein